MKKKKQQKPFSKKELLFNIISITLVMLVVLYFGIRSFYYYSKQNNKIEKEAFTLAGAVINSTKVTKEENGLHQDENGFYFKGMVDNNYVKFSNRIYRIVRINNNNTVKIISNGNNANFMFGDSNNYQESNLHNWLNKTTNENSGIYYDTIPNIDNFLTKTVYREDKLLNSKVSKSNYEYKEYLTTLTLEDYITASGKNSYLNNGKYAWLLGVDKDGNNLFISEDGSIESTTNYESYGLRAVMTLKKDIKITGGSGLSTDPFIVDMNENNNYIDQYVKLDNDIWKVYSDKSDILKLSLNGYIRIKGSEILNSYSNKTSEYNPTNKNNIAYYLNRTYYNNLSYKDLLLDQIIPTGEISNETGLSILNTYTKTTSSKVGLLSIFDYNTNNSLNDYFFLNTTSSVGSMAYTYNNLGLLGEDKVTEKKHIVPTIAIDKKIIKSGDGTIDNPYIMG